MNFRREEVEGRLSKYMEENRVMIEEKGKLERAKKLLESHLETAKGDLAARDSLLSKLKQVHQKRTEV